MTAQSTPRHLKTLLGDHPTTLGLKHGAVSSPLVALDIAAIPHAWVAFKRVIREAEFDVAEMAITTYLMAKAHGKPYVLLPVVVMSRFQHPLLVHNAERGILRPADLAGKRVAIRSYSVTTAMWLRGILAQDHGVDPGTVRWVTFEEAHVAEFRDPPSVESAPPGRDMRTMLLAGEVDAAVMGDAPVDDPRLQPVIPDPAAAARAWHARHQAIQINHMVVVRDSLSRSAPEAVREVFRLLKESRSRAPARAGAGPDPVPIGVRANRRNLEVAIDYVHRQGLIPRPYAVDELFDEVTGTLQD